VKITIELLGLPTLSSIIGKSKELEMPGNTVSDLISFLVKRYGSKVTQNLLDSKGNLDNTIQVMVNETGFLPRESLSEKTLENGDTVRFLLLAGGG
jgi:sulfur carrier protein ThiS